MNHRRFFVGRAIGLLALLILVGLGYLLTRNISTPSVTSFEECVAAGSAVMESYPRQCISKDGTHFTENIGNELEKTNLIRIDSPRPNASVESPLTILGQARGSWFFGASFPVFLTDWDGKIIAQGIATAKGDWMTAEFVPFEAKLTFNIGDISGQYSNKGTLILKKDNPSGLPQNDDALEIPILFAGTSGNPHATTTPAGGILPYHSGIRGMVTLGPTCPVMRNPPDPQCADKPYQTSISIFHAGDSVHARAVPMSDASGTFEVSLPPGNYIIDAKGCETLQRCAQVSAIVSPNSYTDVVVSCDTGIR